MTLTNRQFDEILYLAEQIENGDNFDQDLPLFIRLSKALERDIYDQVFDAKVLRVLSQLPTIQEAEKKRTFWNTVMPKSTYGMYDSYQRKERFREQIQTAAKVFARIQDMLVDDLV